MNSKTAFVNVLATTIVACVALALVSACGSTNQGKQLAPLSVAPNVELLQLGDELFKQRKYSEAKQTYARAVNSNGPDHAYVEACAQVARMESIQGHLNEGRPWLELGITRANPKDPRGWSRLQLVLGIFERENGNRAAAVKRFIELYEYNLDYKLYERAVDVAHHVVLASDDLDVQLEWTHKGIEAAEAGGMHSWLAVLWNNKGASLEEEGRWEDARFAYQEARRYHYEVGDKLRMLIADWALARADRMTGRLDEARNLSEATYDQARERYALNASATNAEWVGYLRWELAELDALDGDSIAALTGLRAARAKLIEAQIETWGDFGKKELARLDGRIEALRSEVE